MSPRPLPSIRLMPVLAAALLLAQARADVTLAPLFQDNAVLQRGRPIAVWGTAAPGESITVTVGSSTATIQAGPSGSWRATVPAQPASLVPVAFVVEGKNRIELSNVVVGEVWLVSGQSNAYMWVRSSHDSDLEQRLANVPALREFKVATVHAPAPQTTVRGTWKVASAETVPSMSAIGYFFARDLHAALNVPVGIISSSWGATSIVSWMEAGALTSNPAFPSVDARWKTIVESWPERLAAQREKLEAWRRQKAAAEARGEVFTKRQPEALRDGPGTPGEPSSLFNAMIHPLVPYGISGFLWYQGENNARHAKDYGPLLKGLITSWRKEFGQGDLPFLFAQLAPHGRDEKGAETYVAELREAQATALELPATGMAVTMDVGDPNDIHPKAKLPVARRLLRHALALAYGAADLVTAAPDFLGYEPAVSREGRPRLRMRMETGGQTLRFTSPKLEGFEVAGSDRRFREVDAELVDNTVFLIVEDPASVVSVRYLWRNASQGTLQNEQGLPVPPYRSDAW